MLVGAADRQCVAQIEARVLDDAGDGGEEKGAIGDDAECM
jgi:hypothetical protein